MNADKLMSVAKATIEAVPAVLLAVLWLTWAACIVGVASIVFSPLAPHWAAHMIKPIGQVQTWIYVAGCVYLLWKAHR